MISLNAKKKDIMAKITRMEMENFDLILGEKMTKINVRKISPNSNCLVPCKINMLNIRRAKIRLTGLFLEKNLFRK